MSLVIAAKDKQGQVWIGADSRSSSTTNYTDDIDKLIPQYNYVVGFVGSNRIGQLIRFNPEKFQPVTDLASAFAWTNALRQLLIDQGYQEKAADRDEPDHNHLAVVVATVDSIYEVESNYQIGVRESRTAIGSGYAYGLGAFDAQSASIPADKRIRRAIKVAANNIPSVGGPIQVRRVE